MSTDKCTADASGFTEGANINNAIRLDLAVLQNAMAVFPEHPKAVGIIDNQQGIVGFCNR